MIQQLIRQWRARQMAGENENALANYPLKLYEPFGNRPAPTPFARFSELAIITEFASSAILAAMKTNSLALRLITLLSMLWLVPALACGSFAPRPTPTPTNVVPSEPFATTGTDGG
ncbi:MAG: hypothetical protein KDE31_21290, partial [Caldilineaceae bacterium]|nr:hypothetical protein [Caldilineaceae bacterium]